MKSFLSVRFAQILVVGAVGIVLFSRELRADDSAPIDVTFPELQCSDTGSGIDCSATPGLPALGPAATVGADELLCCWHGEGEYYVVKAHVNCTGIGVQSLNQAMRLVVCGNAANTDAQCQKAKAAIIASIKALAQAQHGITPLQWKIRQMKCELTSCSGQGYKCPSSAKAKD